MRGLKGEAPAVVTAASDDISGDFALQRLYKYRPQCCLLELLVVAAQKGAGASDSPERESSMSAFSITVTHSSDNIYLLFEREMAF